MLYVIMFLVGTFISWVVLLIVVPIAQKLADFSMPPWPEALWKLAVVAGVINLVALLLDPVNWFLSWIVAAVLFWVLMVKWFDVDFFGATIIVVISWVVRIFLFGLVIAAIASAF